MTAWKIESIRDRDLEADAASLYSDALPYHNFTHALSTIKSAERIIRRCMAEGIRVDPQVVYYALLFHDAGYHENHRSLGYASKEEYSVDLARKCLRERKIQTQTIKKVAGAILSTQRDARFVTAEQKAVRAADLAGLAADYRTFRENARKLKDEHEMLFGQRVAWCDWVARVADTVRFYLAQEIRLTSYYSDESGESAFHHAAQENVRRLVAEGLTPDPRSATG